MMLASDVVVQPHRRTLVRTRLGELQSTARQHGILGDSLGAAVAYRPSVGYVLIGGEHRWKALSGPGARTQVIILRTWDDLVAWMAIDKTDTRGLGFDPVAAVYFYEKAVAALRPGRQDRALEDVAEFTGINRGVLESVRWGRAIVDDPDEAEDVRVYAQTLLNQLEKGGDGGHSVRERVAKFKAKKDSVGRAPESAAVQRKALASVPQLAGIIEALAELGPINPEIPKAEREAIAAQLGKLGALLSRIKKNLRGES